MGLDAPQGIHGLLDESIDAEPFKIKERGGVPTGPEELGKLQKATIAKYAKVIKDAGIVPQ